MLKTIGNILYWILVIVILAILLVVAIQRFSDNTISLGGFKIFNVISESMVPKYNIGDVLLSKEKEIAKIKVGDDIVYKGEEGDFKDRIVTHRVVDIETDKAEPIFHTQGIANMSEDPPILGNQILGVVVYKIQSLSFLSKLMSNIYAFYFIVFIPIAILIILEIRKIIINHRG